MMPLRSLINLKFQNSPTPHTFIYGFDHDSWFVNISVLDRVKAFLPIMKAEQVNLEQRLKESHDAVNIEHIDDEQDQHIEMVGHPAPGFSQDEKIRSPKFFWALK